MAAAVFKSRWLFLFLIVAMEHTLKSSLADPPPPASNAKSENDSATLSSDLLLRRQRIFWGTTTTTVYTDVVLTTSTVYQTCAQGTATAACPGRRAWKKIDFFAADSLEKNILEELDPSGDNSPLVPPTEGVRSGRFVNAITFWTTSRTSITVTTTTTNTLTTIKISYYCQAAGRDNAPLCAAG